MNHTKTLEFISNCIRTATRLRQDSYYDGDEAFSGRYMRSVEDCVKLAIKQNMKESLSTLSSPEFEYLERLLTTLIVCDWNVAVQITELV